MDGKFLRFAKIATAFATLLTLVGGNTTQALVGKEEFHGIFEYSPKWLLSNGIPIQEQTVVEFLLDFTVWSELDHLVIFVPESSALLYSFAVYGYFSNHGKFISVHSVNNPLLPLSLYHNRHRLGVALIWNPDVEDFLNKLGPMDLFNEYRTWIFIREELYKGAKMLEKLSQLAMGIDSNAVICKFERQVVPTKNTPTISATESSLMTFEKGEPMCVPDNQDEYWYREICETGSGLPLRARRQISGDPQMLVMVHQIYKVAKSVNESFTQVYLGLWDQANGMDNLERMVATEQRTRLQGSKVVIGMKNSTEAGSAAASPQPCCQGEGDDDSETHTKEVLDCLLYGLNVSREVLQYPKLGWRNEGGGWTHLLGAVVEGVVDFGLETVSLNLDGLQEMSLTHPIIKTMNNIYFKRPNTGGMRDIFLAPFNSQLIICVFSTGLLLAFAMITIIVAKHKFIEMEATGTETGGRKWEISEAALWSVSVICMQGSPWSPHTKSGSILLICSLLFALVIYNSYAAFITSVLSVKTVRIKNLEDLLHNNFRFGYTLGKTDELFLRTVNDSLLRELYFKGLRNNDGVNDPITGMHRAGKGNYAFFVAARTARRALRKEVAYRERCGIQEMILTVTRTVAAIPVSRQSPYRKIINFRLIRMIESGILYRFQRLILPSMPKCVEKTTFNSARLNDVYTAFYMLFSAWTASCLILIAEIVWQRRISARERFDWNRNWPG